jgi:hypothetical protein
MSEPERQRPGWSSFNSQLINPNMDNNTPSFA